MNKRTNHFLAFSLIIASFSAAQLAWVSLAPAQSQTQPVAEPAKEKEDGKKETRPPRNNGSQLRNLFRRVAGRRDADSHLRDHPSVLAAFKDAVSQARKSTVAVIADGDRVAMGTIVSEDGFVLTKASQLKTPLECRLADGRRVDAKLVGIHRDSDLAMLKVQHEDLPVIGWSDSDSPVVGSFLATTGLDDVPRAIGVVSAVPRRINAPPPMLGIQLDEDTKGPRVNRVLPDSAAEKAGVLVNDVVLSVNGRQAESVEGLIGMIRKLRSGDRINLVIARGEEQKNISATLGSFSDMQSLAPNARFQNQLSGALSVRRAGFTSALQHDTVLKPEDCGGPLVGLDGKAIGINIARDTRVSSLALPIAVIKPIIAELKSGKLAPMAVATPGE